MSLTAEAQDGQPNRLLPSVSLSQKPPGLNQEDNVGTVVLDMTYSNHGINLFFYRHCIRQNGVFRVPLLRNNHNLHIVVGVNGYIQLS
ncbi:hypothetical protein ACJX0J_011671, partial [Zea mays]